ncbi:PREDICTED: protection of telomeres protein 1-like [Poecilia mexicana]|uniref:protection of telomeres protein 1-like n=1 Tax=Poecilia mexicana TaxID=48701 RepID=UPI00072DCD52|nr:PREDICTED: protection of telomeres protein 1-like [Poecilia mexicana]
MTEGKTEQLIFLMGCSLEETQHLAAAYPNVVPVAPSGGRLALLDLTAPFLFRGTNRHYGCKRCSEAAVREPSAAGVEQIDEKMIAETLGVQPLQLVLLMKLQLQDATDTLDVYLWRHAELFFSVAATDVSANQEAQNSIHRTMETLCPAEGSIGERPWLDLCLMAYQTEGEDRQIQTCYQICNTVVVKPCCNSPDNTQ